LFHFKDTGLSASQGNSIGAGMASLRAPAINGDADAMDVDDPEPSKSAPSPMKNVHLKGRKRFNADLADMKEECKATFKVAGLTVKGTSASPAFPF
jgi:hypothetical protein